MVIIMLHNAYAYTHPKSHENTSRGWLFDPDQSLKHACVFGHALSPGTLDVGSLNRPGWWEAASGH
jgi:hypothetical protein